MLKEIIILRNTGIPLFHYKLGGIQRLDEVVTAFFSAIGSIVEQTSDQQLQEITFSNSKFVWLKKGDLYIIALVSVDESTVAYQVILQEIAERFVGKFYDRLQNIEEDADSPKIFEPFGDVVEEILGKFVELPIPSSCCKTMFLAPAIFKQVRKRFTDILRHPSFLRGAVLTFDGYFIISNLNKKELAAIREMLPSLRKKKVKTPIKIVYTGLETAITFVIYSSTQLFYVFTTETADLIKDLKAQVQPIAKFLEGIDFSKVEKIDPEQELILLYDYDFVKPIIKLPTQDEELLTLLSGVENEMRNNALRVIKCLRGGMTINRLQKICGLPRKSLIEALTVLVIRNIIRLNRVYPVLKDRDNRFFAYLELIGMPKRDYLIVKKVSKHCDGTMSINQLAKKTGVPAARIVEVLRRLGNHVEWLTKRSSEQIICCGD